MAVHSRRRPHLCWIAGIAHHPHTALKVAVIVAASLGVIGLLVLIGYIARDRNRVDKGIY
jgi:hypothetical protein